MDTQKDNLDLSQLEIFKNDPHSIFLYRKAQGIVTAIYLVSNYFDEKEAIKWRSREQATALLSYMLSFVDSSTSEKNEWIDAISSVSLELRSLVEISLVSKFISDMNYQILKSELENLILLMENQRDILNLDLSGVSLTQSLPAKGHTENQIKEKNKSPGDVLNKVVEQNKINKTDRKEQIVTLFQEKARDLTIKDITEAIKDCSEKTIQRELSKMVEGGLLKKSGERRWSRYSLV